MIVAYIDQSYHLSYRIQVEENEWEFLQVIRKSYSHFDKYWKNRLEVEYLFFIIFGISLMF